MYFSKNSRYVLKRAQLLSPTLFRAAEKNLSVKIPQDDPSKPPLRLNIPKDSPQDDDYTKSIQTTERRENRSRSFTPGPRPGSISSSLEDDLLPKSESEIHFPNFVTDDYLIDSDFDKASPAKPSHHESFNLGAVLKEEAAMVGLGDTYLKNEHGMKKEIKSEPKITETITEDNDPRSLYIIIDVPDSNQKLEESASEINESNKTETDERLLGGNVEKQKGEGLRAAAHRVSKSASRVPILKGKPERTRRFEIREVDETETYVFHVRLNGHSKKPSKLGCVPEKEITTRNEKFNADDSSIKITDSAGRATVNPRPKQLATSEDPVIKYQDASRKHKTKREEESKPESSQNRTSPQEQDTRPPQRYMVRPVLFRDRRGPAKFERDDFDTVRTAKKNYPFRIPLKEIETKAEAEESMSAEEAQVEASSGEEVPAGKMEKEPTLPDFLHVSELPFFSAQSLKDKSAEEKSAHEMSEQSNSEQSVAEQSKAEQSMAEQLKAEQSMAEQSKVEQSKAEQSKVEQSKAEQTMAEQSKAEQSVAEQSVVEQLIAEQLMTEHLMAEQLRAAQLRAAQLRAEQLRAEQAMAEQSKAEQSMAEQSKAEQSMAEQSMAEHLRAEQLRAAQLRAAQLRAEQAMAEQSKAEQSMAEQSMAEQSMAEQPVAEQSMAEHLKSDPSEIIPPSFNPDTPPEGYSSPYSIYEKKKETPADDSTEKDQPIPPTKLLSPQIQGEVLNFQTSSNCVSIACEKVTPGASKFCAAFPPLLSEALKNRFKLTKDIYFGEKIGIPLKSSKSCEGKSKTSKVTEFMENSILFPKTDTGKFDCEYLFSTREDVILNIIKNAEEEKPAARVEKSAAVSGGTEKLYADSLTVMKKVKDIVQFDLDNVVRIFHSGEPKDLTSVVVSKGDGWQINAGELQHQVEKSARQMQFEKNGLKDDIPGEKPYPKYLPSTKETTTEMKLLGDKDSVIIYDQKSNEFFINKNALAETIARKTHEPLSEVSRTLDAIAKECKTRGGDSILVFDDETQTWKVDFSILERREEQLKIEEELTKRSEMILETFEKLEKGQISNVTLPDSREKRTFDYKKEEWSAYNPDKKTKEKLPFKESDAEEIRKQNSDLYDNLFVANKKVDEKEEKMAPGLSDANPKKSRALLLAENKEQIGKNIQSNTPSTQEPTTPTPKPTSDTTDKPIPKDGHFWETFLDMNILPRDIRDIPKQPSESSEPELPSEEPKKKIDEPKFKIRIPFIKDKKIDKSETTSGPKGSTKEADGQDEPSEGRKKEPVKAPPFSGSSQPKGEPMKKPPPTIGAPKLSTDGSPSEVKVPFDSSKPKIEEPKSGSKPDKMASIPDHYVSDKIIEISRTKPAENLPKVKTNKIETVKLNITSDTRLPSKVTEINLSKKTEEKAKETTANPVDAKTPADSAVKNNDQTSIEKKTFPKNLEKYQTPFSDPDYEEKSLKIKSDIESNPNLKKLDNWSKTLVLHDIMKPPENIESWLKDETDKMATLLLKVLQEAADGKPKKKQLTRVKPEKQTGKGNPYDNIRRKHETTPENFLFRVRTVNFALENDKKKPGEAVKLTVRSEPLKEIPVQSEKTVKPTKVVETKPLPKEIPVEKPPQVPISIEENKNRSLETAVESAIMSREANQVNRLPLEISDEIPGPEILKKISNTWKVFPILGSQMTIFTLLRVFQLVNLGSSILGSSNPDKSRRHAFSKLFLKYGPIVNVQGPLSGNVILIHTPEHLSGVFDQDITTSIRSVFDSLEQSRRDTEETGFTVGIATDWSKPEWNDLKRETMDPMLKGSSKYFGLCDASADTMVSNIRKNRNAQNYVSEDFMEDIRRWSLEGLCSIIFEKSFGFLEGRSNGTNWIMEPDKLYLAIEEATNCLSKCERGFQMWRLMSTPSAAGLGRAYRTISSILSKQLYQAEINLKNKSEVLKSDSSLPVRDLTFIESMLLNDGMTTDEITCNLVDMILIGTNAMNSAMAFLLYNLAQNVKVQMKLLKELKEVCPKKDSPLSYSKLVSLKYLQACLKETLRLHFPVPVFYRLLQNDILLANYIVPKGTFVVMDYRVSSMKEQLFDDPDKFMPERWLMENQWMMNIHPFGAFPLCHGPRAELAKKVVELQLMACIAKVVRNFQIEYQFGEIQGTDAIISVPDKPLKLNFLEREA